MSTAAFNSAVLVLLALLGLTCEAVDYHQMSEPDDIDATNKQNEVLGVGERKYWQTRNNAELLRELRREQNTNRAKNIVFLMGDGYSTIDTTVARIFKDQIHGVKPAGYRPLVYEQFDYNGELRTLSCDNWATDSAAAITAYASGSKANEETLNVNCNAKWKSCDANVEANRYTIITELLKQAGKAVGVVTTTTITHASPAGFYAHSTDRTWESDFEQTPAQRSCQKDIARQLVEDEPGRQIDVLLGGGWNFFLPANKSYNGITGHRQDDRNLLGTWLSNHEATGRSRLVLNRTSLLSVDASNTDFLMGLFNISHLSYQLDRIPGNVPPANITPEQIEKLEFGEPTLLEMVQKALAILQTKAKKTDKGFFLYVEGGKIDLAHHNNQFAKALHETLEWERAVRWVVEHTDQEDTLVIASSDHAHSAFFIGHAQQTESILGEGKALYETARPSFSTLGYASGPGANDSQYGPRMAYDAVSNPLEDKNYAYQAAVYMKIASHGGQDVPVFANGPWAHLVNGVHDNTYLFDVMTFAACLPVSARDADAEEEGEEEVVYGNGGESIMASERSIEPANAHHTVQFVQQNNGTNLSKRGGYGAAYTNGIRASSKRKNRYLSPPGQHCSTAY